MTHNPLTMAALAEIYDAEARNIQTTMPVLSDEDDAAMAEAIRNAKPISLADLEELEYLRWFHANADFGPADGDVRAIMDDEFRAETGKELPEGYEPEDL